MNLGYGDLIVVKKVIHHVDFTHGVADGLLEKLWITVGEDFPSARMLPGLFCHVKHQVFICVQRIEDAGDQPGFPI